MTLVGCDLHARKQQVPVLDTRTGEVLEQELSHEADAVERFYRALRPLVTIALRPRALWCPRSDIDDSFLNRRRPRGVSKRPS